jgi:HSP20 family protein
MKKVTLGLVTTALLSTTLSAGSIFFDRDITHDFDRFNRVFNLHFTQPSFANYAYPKLNMSENNRHYKLKFELAGMKKSDIKLSIEQNNLLVLEGEKREELKESNTTYFKEEISYGKFKRVIGLPKDANHDKMTTLYKDGILTIVIPKKEIKEQVSKVIEIQ